MTDAFEEVEESLRQEKASKVWKRVAPFLIGGVALIVGAVAAFEIWNVSRSNEIEKSAAGYAKAGKALAAGDLAGAKAQLVELSAGKGGFAVISNHVLAGVEKDLTNDPVAIEAHLSAAAAADDGLMGDIAILKLAYLKADTADIAELEAVVAPLVKKGGQLSALSRELLAAKALASGDVERARRDYQALTLDLDAPGEMQRRVQQALVVLPKAAPVAETPVSNPTPTTPPAAPAAAPEQTGQPTP